MVKREDVEALLATCEQIHKPNYGVIAECCRAWLALDAAPEVVLDFDAVPGGNVVVTYGIDIHHALVGQVVRLVATSGGGK